MEDGSAVLVGFVTQGESLRMSTGRDSVTIHLHAEPVGEANVLVCVPMLRVQTHKEHSQRTGKGLEMQVGPTN